MASSELTEHQAQAPALPRLPEWPWEAPSPSRASVLSSVKWGPTYSFKKYAANTGCPSWHHGCDDRAWPQKHTTW